MSTAPPSLPWLEFRTHTHLRQRLILSTLTGRPLRIRGIRSSSLTPGLTPSEVSLLRLLDRISNGAHFEISLTGTSLVYKPGILTGAGRPGPITAAPKQPTHHDLPTACDRGVSYYLEVLAQLAPFAKAELNVTFTGGVITSATPTGDASVDTFRTAYLPALARFGVPRAIECRTVKRSAGFPGAGEVVFIHAAQTLRPKTLRLMQSGRVKRIRGVAYAVGVSASNNARMIEAARGVLNRFLPDVYVFSNIARPQIVPDDYGRNGNGTKGGRTKKIGVGFGISLVAETGTDVVYASDATGEAGVAAEDVGRRAAWMLLEEVAVGGCVGRLALPGALTMMLMGADGDVGKILIGRGALDSGFVQTLRDMKQAFGGREVGMREDENGDVVLAVMGRGVGNLSKNIK